jgi:hypothetical protein
VKPRVDHIPARGFILSDWKKMLCLLAIITFVAITRGFLQIYERRLGVLTGPWISGTNLDDNEPAPTTTPP